MRVHPLRTLLAAVFLSALAAPAFAGQRCVVTDPTGTPLNVRRADGAIIGALRNGEVVEILKTGYDPKGKPWAYVAYGTNGEGWVYRELHHLPVRSSPSSRGASATKRSRGQETLSLAFDGFASLAMTAPPVQEAL